ncbi:hypothetical protein [Clostridium estertheticum]|uniref:hypothetical protein n=1 Tax=Clostridium estertheticum TaxID=238834 RepID=UPI001CF4048D|nr:hypothetical protein [Clostridium estertheticum]MCB2360158.1 hypothetical protein [Clostridium estertheticum]
MKTEELKLFVGGYLDYRKFDSNYFQGKMPFNRSIQTYKMSEVLKLMFVRDGISKWYTDNNENTEFNTLTDNEKIKVIINYTYEKETTRLLHFETEQEALNYKNDRIKELEFIENNSTYVGTEQDEYGHFREVYTVIEE